MKRYFALALVALSLVLVLPVSAAAAEIYEFEYMEPIALYEDRLGFEYVGGSFYCPVIIPDGVYNVIFTFRKSNGDVISYCASSVNISFSYNSEEDCDLFSGYIPFLYSSGDPVDLFCIIGRGVSLDGTVFVIDYSLGDFYESPSVSLERVGDLPGSSVSYGDFIAVFEPVSEQISVSSAVSVLAYGTGGCVGMGFGWWGLRKGARMLMAAFRSGKFKL